jgi:hypothetical protein
MRRVKSLVAGDGLVKLQPSGGLWPDRRTCQCGCALRPDREALLSLTLLYPVNANAPAKLRPALTWPAEQAA